jgi:hypothetical protein
MERADPPYRCPGMRTSALILTLALVAAACGDDSADPAPATTAGPTTAAPDTTTPPTTAPATTAASGTTAAPTTAPPTTAAPEAAWETLAEGPPARRDAAMAVADDGTVWLHGGRSGGETFGDLWRFDPGAGAWEQVVVDGSAPTARFGHEAAWDAAGDRLVITFGQLGSDFFSDVWAFDPATGAWTEMAPNGAGPSERYGACSAYDAATNSLTVSHGFTIFGRFDDTWSLDLATAEWTEISPEGERPQARCLHACDLDPATGELVLFGGQSNTSSFLGDTWVLGSGGWSQVDDGTPGSRRFPSLVASNGALHLFGGIGDGGDVAAPLVYTAGSWQPADPEGPPPRNGHAAAAAPAGSILVFGGESDGAALADFWALRNP